MSDALIGSLSILTQVDNAQLTKGLKEAETPISGFVSDVRSLGSGIGSLLGTFAPQLAALLSVGAIVGTAFSGLGKLDELALDAQKIGTTTEALTVLQHAAGRSDVEIGSLQSGMQRLNRTFGEAQLGAKPANEAFQAIGLTVDELKGKDPTELFGLVADRLMAVEDPALRAALGTKLFGKGFADLVPLIQKGSEGIQAYGDDARRFGQILDGDQKRAVDAANDSYDEFGQAVDGASKQLAADLAPAFEMAYEAGTALLQTVGPLSSMIGALGTVVGYVAKGIALGANLIALGWYSSAAGAATFFAMFNESWTPFANQMTERADEVGLSIERLFERPAEAAARNPLPTDPLGLEELQRQAESAEKAVQKVEQAKQDLYAKVSRDVANFGLSPDRAALNDLLNNSAAEIHPEDVRALEHMIGLKEQQQRAAEEQKRAEAEAAQQEKRLAAERQRAQEDEWETMKRNETGIRNRINSLREGAKTEKEILDEKIAFLRQQVKEERITQEEADKLIGKLNGGGRSGPSSPFVGAALAGSQEARDTLLRASLLGGGASGNAEQTIARNSAAQVSEQKKTNGHLQRIERRQPASAAKYKI